MSIELLVKDKVEAFFNEDREVCEEFRTVVFQPRCKQIYKNETMNEYFQAIKENYDWSVYFGALCDCFRAELDSFHRCQDLLIFCEYVAYFYNSISRCPIDGKYMRAYHIALGQSMKILYQNRDKLIIQDGMVPEFDRILVACLPKHLEIIPHILSMWWSLNDCDEYLEQMVNYFEDIQEPTKVKQLKSLREEGNLEFVHETLNTDDLLQVLCAELGDL